MPTRFATVPPMADLTTDGTTGEGTTGDEAAVEACERALALLRGRGEGVATAVVGRSALTRFANSRIHQNVSEDLRIVRLTVAVDGRVARAATTRTDGDGLAALVERALAAATLRPADPDFAGFAPRAPLPAVDHWDAGTAAATPDDRAAVVAAFVEAADAVGGAGGAGRVGGPASAGGAGAGGTEAAGFCSTSA